MKDEQVKSVAELINYVKRFNSYKQRKNLFFRGQLTKYLNMMPSVARNSKDLLNESNYFKKQSESRGPIIDTLAMMQHYGTPTRLLDFTTDPLVSLFFATQLDEREDASIYVLIRPNFEAKSTEVALSSFVATQEDRNLKRLVENFNKTYPQYSLSVEEAENILSHGVFIKPVTIHDKTNKRMEQQCGTFALPGNKIINGNVDKIVPFENDFSYQEILVPFEYHERIRQELDQLGYNSERLLGIQSKEIKYISLPQGSFHKINEKRDQGGPYSQYSVTIESNNLMTIDEINNLGYRISANSGADSNWVWFRRPHSKTGVNIVDQHWYKSSLERRYDWGGKQYNNFVLDQHLRSDYIPLASVVNNKRVVRKHLPLEPNAEKVHLDINFDLKSSQLAINTNLLRGTKLFLTYSWEDGPSGNKTIIVNGKETIVTIKNEKNFKYLKGDVTLPFPSIQSAKIINKYGLDYERIDGDFIKRNDFSTGVAGSKSFAFNF